MPQEHKLLLKYADAPDYSKDLECYERHGGYQALRQALDMKASTGADGNEATAQAQLRKSVLDSGLRGRGGAGPRTRGCTGAKILCAWAQLRHLRHAPCPAPPHGPSPGWPRQGAHGSNGQFKPHNGQFKHLTDNSNHDITATMLWLLQRNGLVLDVSP